MQFRAKVQTLVALFIPCFFMVQWKSNLPDPIHSIHFTGVSKFSRVSVFSDLNNLTDITLMDEYSTLLGYTEAELEHYFSGYMKQMTEKRGMSESYLSETLRKWYNGYSWDGENFVYNPYSILNLFYKNKFKNYWFASGTPTFLTRLMESRQVDLMELESLPVSSYIFDSYDIENLEIPALLFQTGYLTVKKITLKGEKETYHLSYPNQEVRDSLRWWRRQKKSTSWNSRWAAGRKPWSRSKTRSIMKNTWDKARRWS